MTEIALLEREDLKNDLREILKEFFANQVEKEETVPAILGLDDAVDYLAKKGVKLSKSSLYKKTSLGTIPFKRFGKRKVKFIRTELDEWIDGQLSDSDKKNEVIKAVAASARKK